MTATKLGSTLIASSTMTAGQANATASFNMSTYYGALVTGQIVNGGTGPTVASTVTVNTAYDNSTWIQFAQMTASATANATSPFAFSLPAAAMFVQVTIGGNTGQSVTVLADVQQLIGI